MQMIRHCAVAAPDNFSILIHFILVSLLFLSFTIDIDISASVTIHSSSEKDYRMIYKTFGLGTSYLCVV